MIKKRRLTDRTAVAPERTAVRTALWRALHVQHDPEPHVFTDEIGLRLLEPAGGWRERHDMLTAATARSRATIVARARFIEDLVTEQARRGVGQYVLLGAGLDTFAQRHPENPFGLRVFEVDQPGPQEWKRGKLLELGLGIPDWLKLVPVNFETDGDWKAHLVENGFDPAAPAVVSSTGVVAFLTREAVLAKLRSVATLAPGSTLVISFLLPLDLLDAEERAWRQKTEDFARQSGTPWHSLFSPTAMTALAREAGFREVRHVSSGELTRRYFGGRTDDLRPSSGEELLVATT